MDEEEKVYRSLEEYFRDHPDEESGYYDDMAELAAEEVIEYPEDWRVTA